MLLLALVIQNLNCTEHEFNKKNQQNNGIDKNHNGPWVHVVFISFYFFAHFSCQSVFSSVNSDTFPTIPDQDIFVT